MNRPNLNENPTNKFGKKVLIIDDEPDIRSFMRFFLEKCGLQIVEAQSVSQAILQIEKQRPDLIITDMKMPNQDGSILLKWLKENSLKIPTLVLTGYADFSAQDLMAKGADFFLHKPIKSKDLIAAVEKLLKPST